MLLQLFFDGGPEFLAAVMIWPAQIRAARALLGLSQAQLAERAEVGLATVQRVERADEGIRGTARSLLKLQLTLEELGVVFIAKDDGAGYGVRLRTPRDEGDMTGS